MRFNIHGDKVKITEGIRKYIEEKLAKIDKYFTNADELNARILVKIRGHEQIIEVTILIKNMVLRAEEVHSDLYAAIDLVVDKLENQIRKNKPRMHDKLSKEMLKQFNLRDLDDISVKDIRKIVKRKKIEMKPIDEQEAILEMSLIGHDFFVFKDRNTNNLCVLYKRNDGQYGIIETD